jgi:hypothetical protein
MPRHFQYAQRTKQQKQRGRDIAPSTQPVTPEQTGAPENVVQMQRVIGNRMTQRAFGGKSSGLVQRLTTADEMIGKAGEPQKDKFFGLKKMSAKYKAVLDALRSYDDRLNVGVETAGARFAEGMEEQLDGVARVCTEYITAHGDDPQRTPHITKLRDVDIPAERAVLNVITTNPGLRAKFAGKSIREAIIIARDKKALDDAVQSLANATPSQTKQDEAKQAYTGFLGTGNEELTGTITEETKSSGTQPFRGSDKLTAKGKLVTEALGQDYIKGTVMPMIGKLLTEAIGKDVLTSASALTSPDQAKPEEVEKTPATIELINKLYGQLVQGLLVNSKGGVAIPPDILEAAAQTFARVYDAVEHDPKAEHTAMHAARISVVNMIFLRFINPVLMKVASQLPSNTGVQFIALRLSQIFQGQANGLDLVKKFPELSDSQDLVLSTGAIIDQIIGQVVENGMAKALVLKARRPPPVTRTRGRMVLGGNRVKT